MMMRAGKLGFTVSKVEEGTVGARVDIISSSEIEFSSFFCIEKLTFIDRLASVDELLGLRYHSP